MKLFFIFITILCSSFSHAKIRVVTTTTDIAWLVKEIGQDNVEVESLLNGTEDPHYVDAMPHWISKVANADVFCFVGMDLEVGWAPKVLAKSGNSKVQKGGKGHCNAGKSVKALDVPSGGVDRSMGDVHAGGNPHYHLSPSYFLQAAESVLSVLLEVDGKNSDSYLKGLDNLSLKLSSLRTQVENILKAKKDIRIISYHKEFSYFFKEFGLKSAGEIEETPGVPPSAGRIARVGISSRTKVSLTLATNTNPQKILNKFSEISGVPVVVVPLSVTKNGDYEDLILNLAKSIIKRAR